MKIVNSIITLLSIVILVSSHGNFVFADHLDKYEGEINLKGQVKNGTNLEKDAEYEIKLMATQNSSTDLVEIDSIKTINDFEFTKIEIDETFTYFLMITHEEIPKIIFLEEIEDSNNVEIIVFDRILIPENINIIDYSIMIPHLSTESEIISILGLISFENIGNKTFYADLTSPNLSGLNLLRFSLPENFENLSVDSDLPPGNVMQIPTGFALSNPVPPGQHQILYSYSMPRNTTSINYNIRFPFGAEKFKLLAPDKTDITKHDVLENESTLVDEKLYEVLRGEKISKGEILNIEINKIATPSFYDKFSSFVEKNSISILIGSSSALILFLLISFAIYKNILTKKNNLNINFDEILVEKILDLDHRFKDNLIDEEEYKILRETYKNKIKEKF